MKRFFKYILLVFSFSILIAQEIVVPVDIQIPLIYKILGFEKRLIEKSKKSIVFKVGIVYQSINKKSNQAYYEAVNVFESKNLKMLMGRRLEIVAIDLKNPDALSDYLIGNKLDIIITMPLRGTSISNITDVSKQHNILSFTSVPEYMEYGFSVCIDLKGNKPQIVVNLNSAKEENAEFSSQLLKLAKIIE